MLVNGLETNVVVSGYEWCVNVVILLFSLVLLSVLWPSFENVRWLNEKKWCVFLLRFACIHIVVGYIQGFDTLITLTWEPITLFYRSRNIDLGFCILCSYHLCLSNRGLTNSI